MIERPWPGPSPSGYRTQSRDTDAWAERLLVERWRAMSPSAKFELVAALSRSTHRLSLAGLAHRHPGASPEELELRAACLRLGRGTVEKVLGRRLPFEEG